MFKYLALLAVICLSTTFADETGNVSVNITSLSILGSSVLNVDQEFVEFSYDAADYDSEVVYGNEWSFTESGPGEFILTDQDGDQIVIDAFNNNNNTYLDEILGKVVAAVGGGNTTIANNIGNSIVAGIQASNAAPTPANSSASQGAPAPVVAASNTAPVTESVETVTTAPVVPIIVVPAAPVEAVENGEVETELSISEYVPLSVALGPAPVEVVITEEAYPNGTVVTQVSKYYDAPLTSQENVQVAVVEAVEAVETVESAESAAAPLVNVTAPVVNATAAPVVNATAAPVVNATAAVVNTAAPDVNATVPANSTEVAAENVESAEAVQANDLANAEAVRVVVTEEANPNGTITTTVTRYYNVSSAEAQNLVNGSQAVIAENQQQ